MTFRSSTFVVLALSAILSTDAGSISPVQKVISMIDDFAGKVQQDLDASVKLFQEGAQFCDDDATAKDFAIKDSQEALATLEATIENQKAKIVEYSTNIEDASGKISETEGELYKAQEQRKKDHNDFLITEKEMVATVDELEAAATTLKKQVALAQVTPQAKKHFSTVVDSLSHIVEAAFVTHAKQDKVRAFLQARADAEEALTVSTQNDGNGGVVSTITGVEEKSEATLSDVRKAEMQSNHEFLMTKQSMESEIASMNDELNENAHAKQVALQALAQAEKDLGITKRALAEDTQYLKDLKLECQEKARTFEAEHRDGKAELKALGSAKDILTQKFKVAFVSMKSILSSKSFASTKDDDAKTRALAAIERLGHKFHSTALISLAYRASSDPFGKVRGMVEDMIAKLQSEAAKEATQKAFCDEEMSKSAASKDEKEGKLEKTNSRIEKAESGIAKLSEAVGTLSSEISEIDSVTSEATKLRQAESAAFRVAEKDFSESQDACAQAIEVLREYYEGAAAVLAQVDAHASRDGSGIIGLLEVAESDFAKMLADARTSEDAADREFKKLSQENKLAKATKEAERKGKESEVKSLNSALSNGNQDKEGISTELDAVVQYLAELKPQCETKVTSYAEKKAKREGEIAGLKEALNILSENF